MRNLHDYLWAASPAEALRLVRSRSDCGAFLSGGTSLVVRQDPDLAFVVDLHLAGLGGLSESSEALRLGASLPLQALLEDERVRGFAGGLLGSAAARTRTDPWRRQATLAGRLLEDDPADLLGPCLLVLDARVRLLRSAEQPPEEIDLARGLAAVPRRYPAEDRSLAEARDPLPRPAPVLVLEVVVPSPPRGMGFALETVCRSALDAPLAAVAVGVRVERDRVVAARVATGGIPSARRAPHAEAALAGCRFDSFAAAQAALDQDTAPGGDWRASAEYRAHAARVLLGRALRRAVEAARNVESGS